MPSLAGLYSAPTCVRDDDPRIRCTACGKVVFETSASAEVAAQRITLARQAMRAYLGPCGHWHLTRVKKRKR